MEMGILDSFMAIRESINTENLFAKWFFFSILYSIREVETSTFKNDFKNFILEYLN